MFGSTPVFQVISPKKTYEGCVASIVLGMLTGVLFWVRSPMRLPAEWSFWFYLISSGLISFGGIFGDLYESLFKRAAMAKDSSQLFASHGGMLDRLDSLAVAFPIMYMCINAYTDMMS